MTVLKGYVMNKLNVHELLVLHLNVERKIGDEIKHHSYIIEQRIDVMKIIDDLISNNYIYKTNSPNIALYYLKVVELKDILRDNKLKLSGNKADLIDRLLKSLDDNSFKKVKLPYIYKPTSLGNRTLEETDYIQHFYPHHSITIIDAYNVVQNANESTDKIEFIYNYYIYQKIKDNEFFSAGHYAERISRYYLTENPNEIKQRIYINLSIYLIGMYEMFLYEKVYNMNNNLREKPRFHFHDAKSYYEKPLYIDKLNKNEMIETYLNDIKHFIDPNIFLATKFINILFAKMEDNQVDINKQVTDIEKQLNNNHIGNVKNKPNIVQDKAIDTKSTSGCLLYILIPFLPLINFII